MSFFYRQYHRCINADLVSTAGAALDPSGDLGEDRDLPTKLLLEKLKLASVINLVLTDLFLSIEKPLRSG